MWQAHTSVVTTHCTALVATYSRPDLPTPAALRGPDTQAASGVQPPPSGKEPCPLSPEPTLSRSPSPLKFELFWMPSVVLFWQ